MGPPCASPGLMRDAPAAKLFFKEVMRADHQRLPFTVGTDKHVFYPEAFAASVKEKLLPSDCKLRQAKFVASLFGMAA